MIDRYKHNLKSFIYYNKDRKKLKIYLRRLWITRINAKIRDEGNIWSSYYSLFINKLRNKNIILNRKILEQIAISNNVCFRVLYNFI
uniref:Large ribosomal subunit protein bL20c n=1 Tax=Epipogium roseum TaxID=556037 RepID=A0A0B4N586_9ASPA|nr:ribosomal protein L20 [Epipogium roseum]AII78963.1 ribosomal protein L20 [Epipogium roseum]AIS35798.1 ribosomal protein L20 [Epipogium roseum]